MTARTLTAATVAASLCLLAFPAPASYADSGDDQTIIVTFDKAQSDPAGTAKQAVEKAGGDVTEVQPITSKTVAVTVADTSTSQANRIGTTAESQAGIAAADTSRKVYKTTTNDTYYSYLWNINNGANSTYGVDAEDAWTTSTGKSAVVGIIDTGITSHSDLNANVITGYDFISDATSAGDGDGWDSDPTDEGDYTSTEDSSWHGTHVAGIIAAVKGNSKGVAGVAPSASIEPIRALGRDGGDEADIIAAIRWGAGLSVTGVTTNAHPADVLNMSLGGSGTCDTALQSAINAAVAAGTAIVVAAGNDSEALSNSFPANCSNVIRVVATGVSGTRASYSNYGDSTAAATISAPGGSATSSSDSTMTHWIISTLNSGTTNAVKETYGGMVGTSMAAPHVSGVIALLRSADTALTVSQLTSLITSNVTALSDSCSTNACGAGIVNAKKAVAALPIPTVSSATISGTAAVGKTLTASASTSTTSSFLSYQWLRSGTAISGATGSTYKLTASDLKKSVSVRVTAKVGSKSATKTSATKTVAYGAFSKTTTPKATGTFKVGKTVKATKGAWSPTPTSYSYRWYRSGKAITGATKSSYKLKKADKGKKISVRVTVKRAGYTTRAVTSSSHKVH